MREIKFRQALIDHGRFYCWHYWGFIDGGFTAPASCNFGPQEPNKHSYQYTGLLDKQGKEIYEGDILQDGKRQVGLVLWAHNSYIIEWQERNWQGQRTYNPMTDDCFSYGEVIGNIYETPELLNEET